MRPSLDVPTEGRKPVQLHAEDVDQEDTEHEARHGGAKRGEGDAGVVGQAIAVQSGEHPQRYADKGGQDQREGAKDRGDFEAREDDLRHGLVLARVRHAEVALHRVGHEGHVLAPDGVVQAVLTVEVLFNAGRDLRVFVPRAAGHGVHQRERDD